MLAREIRGCADAIRDIAESELDVIYGRKYGTALTMDVYTPIVNRNRAGIVWIVSGGLWSGTEYRRMASSTSQIRSFVDAGYTVFAVIHRSQPKYTLLEIRDDVPRAVRYIRYRAKDFGIKPNRIGLIGFSSGGHLALLAATTADDGSPRNDDPVEAVSSRLQAVVAYFPNTDLLNYGEPGKLMADHFRDEGLKMDAAYDFHSWDEEKWMFAKMSKAEVREIFRDTSPLHHVTNDDPPTLLVHGDQDRLVPIQQSEVFFRRMKQVGVPCELFVAKGQGHSWPKPVCGERERVIKWFDRYLAQ
jgi:acetyl esterase/lipase